MKSRILLSGTLICGLMLTGCGQPSNAERDAADEKDARVRNGLEQVHLKNWDKAIEQFEAALAKNPALARPNLELALIYHQQKKDYIRAIYHYKSYLGKRPDTEKRALINGWVDQAKISLAGEIGRSIGSISEELVRLTRENNLLRKQLNELRGTKNISASAAAVVPSAKNVGTMEERPSEEPVAKTEPVAEPVKPKPAPVARTYRVQQGDTLTRIAATVYADSSQWNRIYEANRDKMTSENDLKAGQVIIIPNIK